MTSPLVALYVPGSRPDRFAKAVASGADEVILDLEDSVSAADKAAARRSVLAFLAEPVEVPVQVRVNAPGSAELAADLDGLPADTAVRLPKVGGPADVDACGRNVVHAVVETALGVERALEIAAHPAVRSVTLGEADLAAELGLSGEEAFGWVRSRLVVAARAAGLPAPMMSAYPAVADLEGLAGSCAVGRRLGLRGRTAVHPSQVAVIRAAFETGAQDRAWATAVLKALDGDGVARMPDGSMVDAAMARRARSLLGDE